MEVQGAALTPEPLRPISRRLYNDILPDSMVPRLSPFFRYFGHLFIKYIHADIHGLIKIHSP